MRYHLYLILIFLVQFRECQVVKAFPETSEEESSEDVQLTEDEKKFSDKIVAILEHYKQQDPKGLPVVELPDPYFVHNVIAMKLIYLSNIEVHRTNDFRINYGKVDIRAMQVNAVMTFEKLNVVGTYSFIKTNQPFAIQITQLKVTAEAELRVERDGKLKTDRIVTDLEPGNMTLNLENKFISGMINFAGPDVILKTIQPFILKDVYAILKTQLNKQIDEVAGDLQFPNSISPLDMVIADLRKKVHQINNITIDPFKIENSKRSFIWFVFSQTETNVTGMSSFQRVGNITLIIENNTMIADFELGTQKLEGQTKWKISLKRSFLSRAGSVSFSVEYVRARVVLAQPLDTRKKAEIRDLDLEVGNIQMRCNGAGSLDYIVEMSVNILPNLLRYQIMDALENVVMGQVQQQLNKIDIEVMCRKKLPGIAKSIFKITDVIRKSKVNKNLRYDDDEFFNF